jgi:2-aminoethylphosphonate-pyruvate transaminase
MKKRVMVDMSATLIHHGHIRLLKKASEHGKVIVGLTTDEEVFSKKGYTPELNFKYRKEILESIKYVSEVVAVPWLVDSSILIKHSIDLLVHGDDNTNNIPKDKLLIFPRTEGVCSSDIRKKSLLITNNVKRNVLLNPGPATTSNNVKFAQVVPDICPREKEFGELMHYVSSELANVVSNDKKHTAVLFGGSGTAAVESMLTSVVPHDSSVLIVNNGAYGKRMCQIASRYCMNFIEFKSSPINPIDIKKLESEIKSNESLSHIAVVHNETTTGLLNNLDDFGSLANKYNLKLIVDSMSSYGAINIDMNKQNIAYLAASSNKNIQGMAGISFVIAHVNNLGKLEKIKPRTFYLNLYEQYVNFKKTYQMRFTPPVQTMYALKEAIIEFKKEGLQNRYERYSKSCKTLRNALDRMNLDYLVEDRYHSKIITSIKIPDGIDFDDMHDFFYQKGFTIYPGKVEEFNTFRVANIGDINSRDMEDFIELLKDYLAS